MPLQSIKDNPYLLPDDLYKRVLYTIKGYYRMKEEYKNYVYKSPLPPNGMPRSSDISDPTANKAMVMAVMSKEITAIDRALKDIPPEFREGLLSNVVYDTRYSKELPINIWSAWKRMFIWQTAKNLDLV